MHPKLSEKGWGQGAPIEAMHRLRESLNRLRVSNDRSSRLIFALTIVLIIFTVEQVIPLIMQAIPFVVQALSRSGYGDRRDLPHHCHLDRRLDAIACHLSGLRARGAKTRLWA